MEAERLPSFPIKANSPNDFPLYNYANSFSIFRSPIYTSVTTLTLPDIII